MEIMFSKESVIKILELYYKKYEDDDAEIIIEAYKDYAGTRYEECAATRITMNENILILGEKFPAPREKFC